MEEHRVKLIDESSCTNASTQLQSMTEDCLLEIFSAKSLELMDLCSLAETCKRFRPITQRVIGKTLNFKAHEGTYEFISEKFYYITRTRDTVNRLLRNFGSCLSLVSITAKTLQRDHYMLDLAKKHCGKELKYLTLRNQRVPAALAEELKPIFRRLHTFKLTQFSIEGNKSLFSEFDSLVVLSLMGVWNCDTILENFFPTLERFTYDSCQESYELYQDDPYLENVQNFITSHTALKSIDISLKCDQSRWMNILQTIKNNCTDLQELSVCSLVECVDDDDDYTSISLPLVAMKSLKILKFSRMSLEHWEAFSNLTELRELELEHCILPIDVDQLASLSQLQQLSLINCEWLGLYDVAEIIQQLVNLVELKLVKGRYFAVNGAMFSKIVGIVKGRPNMLKLMCHCTSTALKRARNQNVQLFRLCSR